MDHPTHAIADRLAFGVGGSFGLFGLGTGQLVTAACGFASTLLVPVVSRAADRAFARWDNARVARAAVIRAEKAEALLAATLMLARPAADPMTDPLHLDEPKLRKGAGL